MKAEWKKIGVVGVDSGQLMVCDPCYIDGLWKHSEYERDQRYKDVKTGRIYSFGKDFSNFEEKMGSYKGQTPNQLIKEKIWKEMPEKPVEGFSYNAVSHKGNNNYKQINWPYGGPGNAVSFNSGYGDGLYPVYARFNKEGRIAEVKIVMIEEKGDK
jgi:hypothetical protein